MYYLPCTFTFFLTLMMITQWARFSWCGCYVCEPMLLMTNGGSVISTETYIRLYELLDGIWKGIQPKSHVSTPVPNPQVGGVHELNGSFLRVPVIEWRDWEYWTQPACLPFCRWLDIPPPRSESPVQWQGRIKPTESHIADLKAKFQDWRT